MRRSLFALLVVIAAARGSSSMAAAPELEPLRVELAAPAACPSEPSLFARVRTHTSRVREARPGEAARLLRVDIASHDGGFIAELRLVEDGDELQRRVPGRTCDEVLAAVALIAALAIDSRPSDAGAGDAWPSSTRDEALDAGADAATLGPAPRWSSDAAAARDAAVGREPEPARVVASFGTSLAVNGLGEPVLGSTVWIEGALASRLSPALRLRLARSRSFTVDAGGRSAIFRLSDAALEGCVAVAGPRPFQLRPCAQVAVGVFEGASSAFGPTQSEARPWVSAGGFLQGRWRFFGPLALEASFGFTVPLLRDDFFFRPRTPIYLAPPLLLVGDVGVGTTFR